MANKINYIIFGASGDLSKRYLLPSLGGLDVNVVKISRNDYDKLGSIIDSGSDNIFHLAIPPKGVPKVLELIYNNFGQVGLKIVLEKPFGSDLNSAKDLVFEAEKYFKEDQIYRVDHYLAKKSVRNIAEEEWAKENIKSIKIIASEKIGIEGRIHFYEQTGALRDFVQSHLLELAAITLAGSFEPELRYEALKNLQVVCDITKDECVKRGQYEGYTEEVGSPSSKTETFVSINMISNHKVWHGVSITLATGKALNEKLTQIVIEYKNNQIKVFSIEHEPEAYKHVISSVIKGEKDLFISAPEILESWRILDAIQETWKNSNDDLIIYKKGSVISNIQGYKIPKLT
ncbi:MAG: hypothetical protein WCP17_03185 [bacterium]